MEDPEELAWLGMIDDKQYLEMTAHYGAEHHMKQQKYRDMTSVINRKRAAERRARKAKGAPHDK